MPRVMIVGIATTSPKKNTALACFAKGERMAPYAIPARVQQTINARTMRVILGPLFICRGAARNNFFHHGHLITLYNTCRETQEKIPIVLHEGGAHDQ